MISLVIEQNLYASLEPNIREVLYICFPLTIEKGSASYPLPEDFKVRSEKSPEDWIKVGATEIYLDNTQETNYGQWKEIYSIEDLKNLVNHISVPTVVDFQSTNFDPVLLEQSIKNLPSLIPVTIVFDYKSLDTLLTLISLDLDLGIRVRNTQSITELLRNYTNLLKFNSEKLIPTVTLDQDSRFLMMAYSSRESVDLTIDTRYATYFSRSRSRLWKKGETSGNLQQITKIRMDCDRDTLVFYTTPLGPACHRGTYSCIGGKQLRYKDFFTRVQKRIINPDPNSYTQRLIKDPKLLSDKIAEESNEVINYTDKMNLVWEIADLTYFVSVLMIREGIRAKNVLRELKSRERN